MKNALFGGGRLSFLCSAAVLAVTMTAATAATAAEREIKITPKKIESRAPSAKTATKGSTPLKSAWVKLCENAPLVRIDKNGKEVKETKKLCLTHHERLDGNTGMVLVSAAIRSVEGQKKKSLMVMVPLGMAIPPGLRAAVYSKAQWARLQKKEKIDDKELKPIDLRYTLCHPAGCTAETEATPEILKEMSTGGGMMILAMNAAAQPVAFPVPLDGYNQAANGPPIDNKKYAEARSALMRQIRARQEKLAEEFKKKEMSNLPLNAPGSPVATGSTAKK